MDLAGFALLLLMAWVQAWTPGQLAWALWTSGFLMLMAWLAITAVYLMKEDGLRPFKLAGQLPVSHGSRTGRRRPEPVFSRCF